MSQLQWQNVHQKFHNRMPLLQILRNWYKIENYIQLNQNLEVYARKFITDSWGIWWNEGNRCKMSNVDTINSFVINFNFSDLSTMITCMEPVIRSGCGDPPTNMMLKFITLEFTSFEQLYGQLGFAEPLPSPCRTLLSMPTDPIVAEKSYPVANEIVFDQEAYANYNSSFTYSHSSSLLKLISLVLIMIMLI